MTDIIAMPTREDWERVKTINAELAVKVINLLDDRDALAKPLAELVIAYQDADSPDIQDTLRRARAALNALVGDVT